jgi:tRNA uridine 5-carboxymethylaminomethyl modification enzyme
MAAASAALGRTPVALDRSNSYLAVMVDDLTLHGVSEPYRMLTARAEYRLRLRANNASSRLTPLGIDAGCVGPERAAWFAKRAQQLARADAVLDSTAAPHALKALGHRVPEDGEQRRLRDWLRFPEIGWDSVALFGGFGAELPSDLVEEIEEDALYAPYLARQEAELRELRASEGVSLGDDFPFAALPGLSREMVERLDAARPATLGAAGRVPGVTPAALALLLVHARQRARRAA